MNGHKKEEIALDQLEKHIGYLVFKVNHEFRFEKEDGSSLAYEYKTGDRVKLILFEGNRYIILGNNEYFPVDEEMIEECFTLVES